MKATASTFALSLALSALAPATAQNLWSVYNNTLKDAKYVDLTHAFHPAQAVWPGFGNAKFKPSIAGRTFAGFAKEGDEFSYGTHGFVATAYELTTDQYGTQLDPPAHFSPLGATISDLPPTYAVRPLVVINIADKVAKDVNYHMTVADIAQWEKHHGRIPEGSVVMVRSDWYKKWDDPQRFQSRPHPGVQLEAIKFLHLQRKILFHGHEPLDTDTTPDFASETWILKNDYTQAEGVANLDKVPEKGALIAIGFAKPLGGTGGFARYIAIAPKTWKHGVTIKEAPGAPLPQQAHPLKRDANGVMRPTP